MCQKLCENDSNHDGEPGEAGSSRRRFLAVGASALGAAAAFSTPAAAMGRAEHDDDMPRGTGASHRRYILRGGAVLSMDPNVGDFARGRRARAGQEDHRGRAAPARARRGDHRRDGHDRDAGGSSTPSPPVPDRAAELLSDGLLANDGLPHGEKNYLDYIHFTITPVFRPRDAFLAILASSLSQLDAGVTTVVDTSQVGHTPEHTDAVIHGLQESGRRALFVYSPGAGPGNIFPNDLDRIQSQYLSSTDQP